MLSGQSIFLTIVDSDRREVNAIIDGDFLESPAKSETCVWQPPLGVGLLVTIRQTPCAKATSRGEMQTSLVQIAHYMADHVLILEHCQYCYDSYCNTDPTKV